MTLNHRLGGPRLMALALTLLFIGTAQAQINGSAVFEKLSLNKGWKFHPGDIPFPVIKGHTNSYMNAKAGTASGAAAPTYNDQAWRTLQLPHDWAMETAYDSSNNVSQGYRNRGFAWYRRLFTLDSSDRGKYLELQFEGIATYATIWLNGSVVHRNWCGYTSAYIDMTAFAHYGKAVNTIAIRVDANAQEGWWYEGAGIYRNTWLIKRAPLHLITDGVYAHPVKRQGNRWEIPAEVTLANSGKKPAKTRVEMSLLSPDGKLLQTRSDTVTVDPLDQRLLKIKLSTVSPALWSTDQPTLYLVRTLVKINGILVDSTTTRCGFRTIRFDANLGFYLNGKPLKIKGVCNHQDHAGVGVAIPESIITFRLRKLKEMGVNAYRCAHNPPSVEFLNLCDQMGMLVMDENRNFNSSPEYIEQLKWMVRRDRNHPSIILWSVFNEEPMQAEESGYEMVRRMSHEVKKLDRTRPVTAAMNDGYFAPINVSQAVDVVGFNYQDKQYDPFHRTHPGLPMTSSEDESAFMVRGEYRTDSTRHILDAYDTQFAAWGTSHRAGWKAIATRPYVAGAFVWTGFDYHGEPSPFIWPSAGSFFGIMDLCGFPKTAFYLHQAQWLENHPVLHLVPDWNWPIDSIGKPIKVMALSNAESLKLYLNGKLIGEQKADPYEMNTWVVPYQPGQLLAIGYKKGKEVSRYQVETTSKPYAIRLTPDQLQLKGDGLDAMPVTAEVLDAQGRHVPNANLKLHFEISGSGRIIGLGNGDPNSHEPEKGNERSLFNGLAQVIIQTDEVTKAQTLTLKATAEGLQPAQLVIPIIKSRIPSYVPAHL
jgi:beta-galactosidase